MIGDYDARRSGYAQSARDRARDSREMAERSSDRARAARLLRLARVQELSAEMIERSLTERPRARWKRSRGQRAR
jgi:hypothetical protein